MQWVTENQKWSSRKSEIDSCYVKAERMTNTDINEKLIYYIFVEYWYVPYFTFIVLSAYLEKNSVRVCQIVLASTLYQDFCVVHLSGEDMRWNSFQHLSKHYAGLHRNRSITNCISIAAFIFQTFCSSKQRTPQADCC